MPVISFDFLTLNKISKDQQGQQTNLKPLQTLLLPLLQVVPVNVTASIQCWSFPDHCHGGFSDHGHFRLGWLARRNCPKS